MAKQVVLTNGKRWPAKKDAVAHFKAMLARYKDGQVVSQPDAGDLAALLERYDRCLRPGDEPKIGAGVSHFSRQLNRGEGWSTSGFHVHRIDGTSVDFSYRDAIQHDPSST